MAIIVVVRLSGLLTIGAKGLCAAMEIPEGGAVAVVVAVRLSGVFGANGLRAAIEVAIEKSITAVVVGSISSRMQILLQLTDVSETA